MAIVALHPFFQMDIREVHSLAKAVRIVERDLLAFFIEPVSLTVVAKHRAENPAVSVEIRKLCGL